MKTFFNKILFLLGYIPKRNSLEQKNADLKNAEGFPRFVEEAALLNMDVNDYLELKKGWGLAEPVICDFVFPLINNDQKGNILEIGPGTGRQSRHVVSYIKNTPNKKLFLLEHSVWTTNFLKQYFNNNSNVVPLYYNDIDFPLNSQDGISIVYSFGTFIELKLGRIRKLAEDIHAILPVHGKFVFNFLDISRKEGISFMDANYKSLPDCFTYFRMEDIVLQFEKTGYRLHRSEEYKHSVIVVFEKVNSN